MKWGHLTIKYYSGDGNLIPITEIQQQNQTTPTKKSEQAISQEFRKECKIFVQQKCKLYKTEMKKNIFSRNRFQFSKACSQFNFYSVIQFFSPFSTIKNHFFLVGNVSTVG